MLSQKENIEYWTNRAKTKNDWEVTSNDPILRQLEYQVINKYLKQYSTKDSIVIDLGCGTGHVEENLKDISYKRWYGIDPTKSLIELTKPQYNTEYIIGDSQKLWFLEKPDILFTVRALINIEQLETTLKCINHCCKSTTQLFFLEATQQGLQRINEARQLHNLPLIQEAPFNHYLDESILSQYFNILHIDHFASSYYYGSRIINPLVNNQIDYNSEVNNFFVNLSNFGDWGLHRLFHCELKDDY